MKQQKTRKTNWIASVSLKYRFLRFIFVGFLNTLFGYSIFALFILIKIEYHVALTLSTIFGILFNFKTTSFFVFKTKNNKLIFSFIMVYFIVYLLNQIVLTFTVNLGLHELISQALALPFMSIIAYYLHSKFVFTK